MRAEASVKYGHRILQGHDDGSSSNSVPSVFGGIGYPDYEEAGCVGPESVQLVFPALLARGQISGVFKGGEVIGT